MSYVCRWGRIGHPGTSPDIPGTSGTWDCGQCPRWDRIGHPGISQDIPGTSGTWDSGQCPRWDRIGHPGISQDIPGTFGTWNSGQCPIGGTGQDIPGYPRISQGHMGPGTLGNVLGGTG